MKTKIKKEVYLISICSFVFLLSFSAYPQQPPTQPPHQQAEEAVEVEEEEESYTHPDEEAEIQQENGWVIPPEAVQVPSPVPERTRVVRNSGYGITVAESSIGSINVSLILQAIGLIVIDPDEAVPRIANKKDDFYWSFMPQRAKVTVAGSAFVENLQYLFSFDPVAYLIDGDSLKAESGERSLWMFTDMPYVDARLSYKIPISRTTALTFMAGHWDVNFTLLGGQRPSKLGTILYPLYMSPYIPFSTLYDANRKYPRDALPVHFSRFAHQRYTGLEVVLHTSLLELSAGVFNGISPKFSGLGNDSEWIDYNDWKDFFLSLEIKPSPQWLFNLDFWFGFITPSLNYQVQPFERVKDRNDPDFIFRSTLGAIYTALDQTPGFKIMGEIAIANYHLHKTTVEGRQQPDPQNILSIDAWLHGSIFPINWLEIVLREEVYDNWLGEKKVDFSIGTADKKNDIYNRLTAGVHFHLSRFRAVLSVEYMLDLFIFNRAPSPGSVSNQNDAVHMFIAQTSFDL